MIERARPTLLVLAACLGLAAANLAHAPGAAFVFALLVAPAAIVAAVEPRARFPACAVAVVLAGWGWGTARLDALAESVLAPEIGRSDVLTVVVTGPVRRTQFSLRVPAEVRRLGERRVRERVLLELPLGRSPPQGSILELRALLVEPRGPEDGFDERGWLARRGVHVVLRGGDWRVIGHRGGLGGLSDRLRAHLARAVGAGQAGERRGLLVGHRPR